MSKNSIFTQVFAHEVFLKREELKLTQRRVAEAVGISTRWYQKIENGTAQPSLGVGICLMVFLGISPEILVREVGVCVPICPH